MSGGAFDYKDAILSDLQDTIAKELGLIRYGSDNEDRIVDEKTEMYMKNICSDLCKLARALHSLDWYLSGDIAEDDFISDYEKIYSIQEKLV